MERKDKAAYEKLFKAHYQGLYRYAFLQLKEKEVSEEVVQDVMLTIWEKREQLEVTTSFRSYLYRSVYNRCMNQLKHIHYRENYKEHNSRIIAEAERDSFDKVEEEELYQRIQTAIETLPEERKRVFKLVKVDGLKYKEAAEQLNISVKTVENQMGSALKYLREQLTEFLVTIILINTIFF